MPAKCPIVNFDHHSSEFSNNRTAILRDIREFTPICYTESYGGYWVVTSYELATFVLNHPDIFSSEKLSDGTRGVTIPSVGPRLIPAECDAPFHTKLRKVINTGYSPKVLRAFAPVVREVVTDAIDRVMEKKIFDIVEDISEVVPSLIGLRHLGFPEAHRTTMVKAIKIALATNVKSDEADQAFQSACGQMLAFVQSRRADPGDDLMSTLTQSTDPTLSDEESMWIGLTLFVGGFKNPGAHISNMLLHLAQVTDLRQRLIADRALIPKAIIEFLRFYSAGVSVARTVMIEIELGGCVLKKGDRVLLVLPAANRDEATFEHGELFDIDRQANRRHLAFGGGPHFCAGSQLANTIFEVLLNEIFDKMPNYTVDATKAVRVSDAGIQAAYITIPASTGA